MFNTQILAQLDSVTLKLGGTIHFLHGYRLDIESNQVHYSDQRFVHNIIMTPYIVTHLT